MKSDTYHHGKLKEELIEKGLEYIAKYGTENLSMRKLADSVGVSPAAPYAHFKNKEAFLSEIRDYITNQFHATLKKASDHCTEPSRILLELGRSYVLFFYENPLYRQFLFSIDNIDIENYPPFVLFNSTAESVLKRKYGQNTEYGFIHAKVIALWSLVHGLSAVVSIKGVVDTNHLDEEIERILVSINV